MPLVDLPLEALREYQGRTPRPVDFDHYWKEALDELSATPIDYSTEAHASLGIAECKSVWFQGTGGARIHAKWCGLPNPDSARPSVLYFHGYGGKSPEWWTLLTWVAAGYEVFALDCRGQAGRSEDPGGTVGTTWRGHLVRGLEGDPKGLYYRSVYLDTVRLSEVVSKIRGASTSQYATGASQGGGLTLACAALSGNISRAAPIYPFLSDFKRVWEMDLARDAYQELRDWLRAFDPTHVQIDQVFGRLAYIDVQHLASRITCPVMMTTGLMDSITPPSTQFAAYNKVGGDRELLIYPDYGHEGLPEVNERIVAFFKRGQE